MGKFVPDPNPEIEDFRQTTGMEKTLIRVGLALGQLPMERPFLANHLAAVVNVEPVLVYRKVDHLHSKGALESISEIRGSGHQRPFRRTEHYLWDLFGFIEVRMGFTPEDYLIKTWDQVPDITNRYPYSNQQAS